MVLELSTNRPRLSLVSHRGAQAPFDLSVELIHELKGLGRREGCRCV
jgi:hypothetical protein